MNDDFLLSAQDLLKRDDHKRLRLEDRILIYGTEASFESGESNVEMVVTASEAAVTIYIYMEDVRLAASISSSSLQKAAVDGIWITVSVDDIHAYMEVCRIPPDNGGSNFAAIIKLKGPDREQKLSPDESESADEEVGFGGQPADNTTPPNCVGSIVPATKKPTGPEPKQELSPHESEPENEEVRFGGQPEDNTAPPDGVGSNVPATKKQTVPEPKQELSPDESKSQECNVTVNTIKGDLKGMRQENTQMPVAQQKLTCISKQLEENISPPDSVGSNVAATVKQKAPEPKPELFFGQTQSGDEQARSGKSYQIFVKGIDGKTKTYDVTANLTVFELKQMIEQRSAHISVADQILVYGFKQLEDNMTVGHYSIKHLSTVQLTMRMIGG